MSATEAMDAQRPIQAALDQGLDQLSVNQEVQFQRYAKVVLQQDGYVFWVATGQMMTVKGSLHYATDRVQEEDQTIGTNQVLLTSEDVVSQFNVMNPASMWIGSWSVKEQAAPLQVAFAQRGNFYQQANLWHYSGFAVYPAMSTQILSSPNDIPAGPIVSNSLPIWLAQTSFAGQTVAVYPSFLVPDNIVPPYVVAHIDPAATMALGSAPFIGPWPGQMVPDSGASPLSDLAGSQLMRDDVALTLYGFSNNMAWQYLVNIYEASVSECLFGIANSPVILDEKRPQVEITALAQKKTIRILANYYQGAANVIARRLLLEAMVSHYSFLGGVLAYGQVGAAQDEQLVDAVGSVFE
ncbi:MAG: hypothetical protein ACREML_12500 [Vulcanimicrobiaceae bacterium]